MGPLVAKLDCFNEAWAKRARSSSWVQVRLNAVAKTREWLKELDADNVNELLVCLGKRASVACNYRSAWCGEEAMLRFQLEFYALVHRCLELEEWARVDLMIIAREEQAPEIIQFIAGETIA